MSRLALYMIRLAMLLRPFGFAIAVPLAVVELVAAALVGSPARAMASPIEPSERNHGWQWPLSPRPSVVRAFDPPERPWLSGHRGVDLAGEPGQAVLAPEDGTVTFAGWVVDRPVLSVSHEREFRSSFEPVVSELATGTRVTRGQVIGRLAAEAPHCAAGCLHWGVRQRDVYVDPLRYVADTRPSILLPWRDP